MNEEKDLPKKREATKQFITASIEKTFPAYFFNLVGRGVARIFRLKKTPHWAVSATILGILIYLPGLLVSLATGEIFGWKEIHFFYLGLLVFAYLSSVVCHINLVYNFLPGIRDGVVDFIQSVEDLSALEVWLNRYLSFGKWLVRMLVGGLLVGILITFGLSYSNHGFIGAGFTVMALLMSPFFVSSNYAIIPIVAFPAKLAGYHLELYEPDPIRSEILQRMIHTLNIYLYLVAGYVALGTALISLYPTTRWLIYYALGLGWIPTIIQFVANQFAIRKMIMNARRKILGRLQKQIKEIQEKDLLIVSITEVERIHYLVDLYDRISTKNNSMLNRTSGLNLLNQLMLPLLGLLLGNIDKLLQLIAGR